MPATNKGVARPSFAAPPNNADAYVRAVDIFLDALEGRASRTLARQRLGSSAQRFACDGDQVRAEQVRRLVARLEAK